MGRTKKEKELKELPVEKPEETPEVPSVPEEKEEKIPKDGVVSVSGLNGEVHKGKFVVIGGKKHLLCGSPDGSTYLVHEMVSAPGFYEV